MTCSQNGYGDLMRWRSASTARFVTRFNAPRASLDHQSPLRQAELKAQPVSRCLSSSSSVSFESLYVPLIHCVKLDNYTTCTVIGWSVLFQRFPLSALACPSGGSVPQHSTPGRFHVLPNVRTRVHARIFQHCCATCAPAGAKGAG